MQFTGKNLRLVHDALIDALAEVHNRIAACPDVNEFAEDLLDCEAERKDYQNLLNRVKRKVK